MSERPPAGQHAADRGAAPGAAESSPALLDADAIIRRAADDEAAASEARERYRDRAIEPLEPDTALAALLLPDEQVLALRRATILDRREPPPGAGHGPGWPGLAGDLYVTSARLVHLGRAVLAYDLEAIRETVVAGERLLLILADGSGITLAVGRPRLLQVEIAAARAIGSIPAGRERNAGPPSA
jgi:hypothetical protein